VSCSCKVRCRSLPPRFSRPPMWLSVALLPLLPAFVCCWLAQQLRRLGRAQPLRPLVAQLYGRVCDRCPCICPGPLKMLQGRCLVAATVAIMLLVWALLLAGRPHFNYLAPWCWRLTLLLAGPWATCLFITYCHLLGFTPLVTRRAGFYFWCLVVAK